MSDLIEKIRVKLIEEGFDGLYMEGVFGGCACHVDDLAPCGECQKERGEDYINGCEPGHKFSHPDDPSLWVVKSKNIAPTAEEWIKFESGYFL
ncbi:MAG TPA: hypothetical protein PKC70_10900 [Cellvibrionaceae bacterium]|nr:hypothetical protein [Cellvibrionaceae bacterium]